MRFCIDRNIKVCRNENSHRWRVFVRWLTSAASMTYVLKDASGHMRSESQGVLSVVSAWTVLLLPPPGAPYPLAIVSNMMVVASDHRPICLNGTNN
jgi:hypothetical protein